MPGLPGLKGMMGQTGIDGRATTPGFVLFIIDDMFQTFCLSIIQEPKVNPVISVKTDYQELKA